MASFKEQRPTDRFDKRKYFRFAVQLPVMLGHQPEDTSSICTNLSWKGVSVETAQILAIGERLAVTVTIAPKEEPLRMLGQVVWSRDTGALDITAQQIRELGIRFLRPLPTAWQFPSEAEESGLETQPDEEELPEIFPY